MEMNQKNIDRYYSAVYTIFGSALAIGYFTLLVGFIVFSCMTGE